MKRRVSEKVLRRIGREWRSTNPKVDWQTEPGDYPWDAAMRLYRRGTVMRAQCRRSLNTGGTVCLDCAVTLGLERC